MQREERDALVARQIALSLEREERQRERELQEMMRLQLRLGDEATQQEFEKRMQEEKDEVTIHDILCLMKSLKAITYLFHLRKKKEIIIR